MSFRERHFPESFPAPVFESMRPMDGAPRAVFCEYCSEPLGNEDEHTGAVENEDGEVLCAGCIPEDPRIARAEDRGSWDEPPRSWEP